MNVVLNGDRVDLPEGATIEDAVAATGAPESRRGLAAALEGEVVPRARWAETGLAEGARVEILQAVQGG
ncbi:MAG: sulfur carrier protein ThiS [Thermoleophilaceae bacterium]|nr:sulfur carrier protein ThiS [Thermoleophilaceae bacterium]